MKVLLEFFYSLRFRLLLLVLLALMPMLGLILDTHWNHRREELSRWERSCVRAVELGAREEREAVDSVRQFLEVLALLPQVRSTNPVASQALLAELLARYPRFSNLGLAATNGDLLCSARPLSRPVNLRDLNYFQQALRTRLFTIGYAEWDHFTAQPCLDFVCPVLDEHGGVCAVLTAVLDVSQFEHFESCVQRNLPAGTTWVKTDPHGRILACHSDPKRWVGQLLPEKPVLARVLRQQSGLVWTTNTHGVRCLYALAHEESPFFSQRVSLILGVPEAALLATLNRTLTHSLLWLALATGLTLGVAWVGGDLFVLRHVRALVEATTRLAGGEAHPPRRPG